MITLIKTRFATCGVAAFLCLSAAGQQSSTQNAPALRPGLIASDSGGAPGYQHGLKQSHFLPGTDLHTVTSDGWSRQAGANGAFAVSLHNGVAMALPTRGLVKNTNLSTPKTPRTMKGRSASTSSPQEFLKTRSAEPRR